MALIAGAAHDGIRAGAGPRLATIALRAGVAVVTRRSIRCVRVGAGARRGVARAGDVALIAGRAHHRIRSGTGTRLTTVALRAGAAVVTRRPIRGVRIRAGARCRITRPGDVALIAGRAHYRVRAGAGARLTDVALRTGVAVATRSPIRSIRVGAGPRRGIAGARDVTLVAGR